MSTVWFVRHGQSTSNAGEITKSAASPRLTALGQKQAECFAGIVPRQPDLIVTSEYVRTQLTAAPTIARFPNVPQVEWPVFEFTYIAAEHYNGTSWPQRMPLAAEYWQRADPFEQAEGSESYAMMMARAANSLVLARESSAEFTLIFSHGIFMKAVIWYLLMGSDLDRCNEKMTPFGQFFRAVPVPNTSVLELEFSAETPHPTMRPIRSDHLPTV